MRVRQFNAWSWDRGLAAASTHARHPLTRAKASRGRNATLSIIIGAAIAMLAAATPTDSAAGPKVAFETSLGAFTVALNEEKAPVTVANFLAYVDAGHYDGVVFHRVIPDFMAQTGGFALENGAYVEKETRDPIQNEAKNGLKNVKGALAMARTGDPHSASAQFFINFKDNSFLDYPGQDGWGYAVFGQVVEGMDVIDQMAFQNTTTKTLTMNIGGGRTINQPAQDVPVGDIVITSAKRVE